MGEPKLQHNEALQFGEYGVDEYSDTSSHTGDWIGVMAIDGNAGITSLTAAHGGSVTPSTLIEGVFYPLPISEIELSSGKVWLYRKYPA